MSNPAIRAIAPALVLLAVSAAAPPETSRPEQELLRRVAENYRRAKRFHLAGTIHAELQAKGGRQTSEASFSAAAGGNGRVRDELVHPTSGMTRVSDGAQTWLYVARPNQYTRKDQALPGPDELDSARVAAQGGMVAVLVNTFRTIADHVESVRRLPDETVGGEEGPRSCHVLEVLYRNSRGRQIPRTFWIDRERLVVLRQRVAMPMTLADGDTSAVQTETFDFSRVSLNQPLADSLFAFRPPPGAKQVEQFSIPGQGEDLSGRMAADFTLPDLGGKKHRLRDHRGKVVMLDFWASWCGPCRRQMPSVDKLYQEYKPKGLVVYAVNQGETAEKARGYLEKYKYTTTALLDPQGEVGKQYQVSGIPTLVIIDREGKIAAHYVGLRPEETLREGLKKAGL